MKQKLSLITDICKTYGIATTSTQNCGDFFAKLQLEALIKKEKENSVNKKQNKLILVTAISPTASGEGKTTVSIGLAQALTQLGTSAMLALREPSLGPVFGMKGGATGGGKSQILPSDDINLHFTGDMHALTSANNLLAAIIDNHIHFGNSLKINSKKILFKRCLDVNDRTLRAGFTITAASELMAVLCLAKDTADLRKRIDSIVVAENIQGKYVYARELRVTDALLVLLKDAYKPNMVQTTEGMLAFVHGGPFANIAHGCNSVLATRAALAYGDVCITEAGFGADLGAEKFFDIKLRSLNTGRKEKIWPNIVVLVATVKSVQAQGEGYSNLLRHIANMQGFGVEVVVAINRFKSDTKEEIQEIATVCQAVGVSAYTTEVFEKGGGGAIALSKHIQKVLLGSRQAKERYLYANTDSLMQKIDAIAENIYRAKQVIYSKAAKQKIDKLEEEFGLLPVCIAKNQYSFSDNPKLLGAPSGHTLHITDAFVQNGAGFVTVLAGTVYTMPGLSKSPAAERIVYTKKNVVQNLK
jgi:formate--tetrahydrofolate ligase